MPTKELTNRSLDSSSYGKINKFIIEKAGISKTVKANTCPCCDNKLLRHISANKIYWFCQHCRQEMPLINRY